MHGETRSGWARERRDAEAVNDEVPLSGHLRG